MDFSSTRNEIENKWKNTDRFFAGIPKIPNAKKESMAVYLPFIQHILWALKDDGKAAVVCPTGFLTAKSGIELKIRQKLIDENWLQGVISMPSNIFANTGTNVSVLFIDKNKQDDKVMLVDASKLGEKRKEGKNQRTVLRADEITHIIDTFVKQTVVDDFSVIVTSDPAFVISLSYIRRGYDTLIFPSVLSYHTCKDVPAAFRFRFYVHVLEH